ARCHAGRSCLHEETIYLEPVFLRECSQSRYDIFFIHISTIIDVVKACQDALGCRLTLGIRFPMTFIFDTFANSPIRLVAAVCAAQVLVQIGAFFWPALLPGMMQFWQLSNSEAGWITAGFYGAYMLAVPVLVTLTDRVDPKRVYLFGVGSTVAGPLPLSVLAEGV